MALKEVTLAVYRYRLAGADAEPALAEVLRELLNMDSLYVLMRSDMADALFLDNRVSFWFCTEKAGQNACKNSKGEQKKNVVCQRVSPADAIRLLLDEDDAVKVFLMANVPVSTVIHKEAFEQVSGQAPAQAPAVQKQGGVPKPPFQLVDTVKYVLDSPSAEERRAYDPGDCYSNFHKLIRELLTRNGTDADAMDEHLGLAKGCTAQLCNNVVNNTVSEELVMKHLEFWGLSEYRYVFKGQSQEIARKLKDSQRIDTKELRPATVSDRNKMVLRKAVRGKDGSGAYVYRLTLEKEDGATETLIVSNQFGLIVGKEYVTVTETPAAPKDEPASSTKGSVKGMSVTQSTVPTAEAEKEALRKAMEKSALGKKKGRS